jgi:hypothetical protein
MISSPLMSSDYERLVPDYGAYISRPIPGTPADVAEKAEPARDNPPPA